MNQIEMSGYKRITKPAAIKAFTNDVTIRIVPCNYVPDNTWITYDLNRTEWEHKNMVEPQKRVLPDWCFNNFCTQWTYYNGNYEMGYYPAFYIKTEKGGIRK